MSTRYHRYGRENTGRGFVVFLGILFIVLGCIALYWAFSGGPRADEQRDVMTLAELRVQYGDALRHFHSLDPDSKDGREAAARVRSIASAHNAILARRPTWTAKPLDTMPLIEAAPRPRR